jgi:hypothetical protein
VLPLILAALALLVVAGGAGLAYWLLQPSSDKSLRDGARTAEANELDWVPRNAVGFVSMRVGGWWASPLGRQMEPAINQAAPGWDKEMEKEVGLKPADLERVTFVVLDAQGEKMWAAVATRSPYDRDKLLHGLAPDAKELQHQGKSIYRSERDQTAVHLVNDHLFVMGNEAGVRQFLDGPRSPGAGPLSTGLKLAADKHHVVAAVSPPAAAVGKLRPTVPPPLQPFLPLLDLQTATLILDANQDIQIDLQMNFPDEAGAKKAEQAARSAVALAQLSLAQMKNQMGKDPQAAAALPMFTTLETLLKNIPIEQQGPVVQIRLKAEPQMTATLPALLLPAVQKVREAANRTKTSNNLKQIALAMHHYHDTFGTFPLPAITDRSGKPLLSWRVALLPFLGEDQLYQQFNRDEPWNGPTNLKLLSKMPKVYILEGVPAHPATSTFFQVFTGPDTPFVEKRPIRLAEITDGASNTLLVVEAALAVPWSKPADLPYDPKRPLPRLGRHFPQGTLAATADGAVRFLNPAISDKTLRAAITRAGGEVMGPDW